MAIQVEVAEIRRAFEIWDTRYRENPEQFWSSVEHLLKNTPETYADRATVYFVKLLDEAQDGR